jgi:hypothetical protein
MAGNSVRYRLNLCKPDRFQTVEASAACLRSQTPLLTDWKLWSLGMSPS